jgi:hypothetical protein
MEATQNSYHDQENIYRDDGDPKSGGDQAPHFCVVGRQLSPSHVANLQLAVYLRGVNDGWNSRR